MIDKEVKEFLDKYYDNDKLTYEISDNSVEIDIKNKKFDEVFSTARSLNRIATYLEYDFTIVAKL